MTDPERIDFWKSEAEPTHSYMTINVSTWHMKIFPEFHTDINEIKEKILHEKRDPACYSTIRLIWDLKKEAIIYDDHKWIKT